MSAGLARPLLLGLDGPEVRITARVATQLIVPLRAWLVRQVNAGARPDEDVMITLHAIALAADIAGTSANGSSSTPNGEVFSSVGGDVGPDGTPGIHDGPMTTKAAAERLGCTERNVCDLAARGALAAERLGRAWIFNPADVDRLATERKR